MTKACQHHLGLRQAHRVICEGVTQTWVSLDLQKLNTFSFGKWRLQDHRPGGQCGLPGGFKVRISNIIRLYLKTNKSFLSIKWCYILHKTWCLPGRSMLISLKPQISKRMRGGKGRRAIVWKISVTGLVITRTGPLLGYLSLEERLELTGTGSECPGFRMGTHYTKP